MSWKCCVTRCETPLLQSFLVAFFILLTSTLVPVLGQQEASSPQKPAELRAGRYGFNASYEMMGQLFEMKLMAIIKEEDKTWAITEIITTPIGEEINKSILEKGTLILIRRSSQGTEENDITFSEGKATGTAKVDGKSQVISADTGAPIFADGAGANFVIASLPLSNGYTTTLRNFDIRSQKVKAVDLRVTSTEKITVPAGTFEAFKIELATAEQKGNSKTLWVAKDTRSVLRVVMAFEERNATFTLELATQPQ